MLDMITDSTISRCKKFAATGDTFKSENLPISPPWFVVVRSVVQAS